VNGVMLRCQGLAFRLRVSVLDGILIFTIDATIVKTNKRFWYVCLFYITSIDEMSRYKMFWSLTTLLYVLESHLFCKSHQSFI
jgi:hypothetical protein